MKTKIVTLVLLFVGISLFSQEIINQFNAKGERNGVWKKYHSNKRIRYSGKFKNGKEVGVFKYYSIKSSEFPIAIRTFEENSTIAKVQFFTENGVLKSEGKMDGKHRIGKWKYYQADGKSFLAVENYKNGKLNGESITYYPNGNVTELLNYNSGKLHGNVKHYTKKGTILDDVNYVNDVLHGYAKYYNEKGELIYEGTYENDEKLDDWQFYMDGKVVKKEKLRQ